MDPEISQQLHKKVFETYNSLKKVIPKKYIKNSSFEKSTISNN